MKKSLFSDLLSNTRTARWILGPAKNRVLLLSCVFQIILASLEVAFLALISPLISALGDTDIRKDDISIFGLIHIPLTGIFLFICAIVFLKNLGSISLQRWMLFSFAERESEVTTAIIQKTIVDKIDTSNLTQSSDLVQIFFGVINSIFSTLFRPVIGFTGDMFTVLALMTGLLIINPRVAALAFIYFVTIGSIVGVYFGRAQKRQGKASLDLGRLTLKTYSEMRTIKKELILSNTEDDLIKKFYSQKKQLTRTLASSSLLSFAPRFILELFLVFGIAGLVFFLQNFSDQEDLLPTLALVIAAGFRLLPSLNNILIALGNFRFALAPLKRIEDLRTQLSLGENSLVLTFPTRSGEISKYSGSLTFSDVSYGYPGSSDEILTNFNFQIPENKSILLTGVSGSGKTTIIGLVTGLIAPNSGTVHILNGDRLIKTVERISGIQYLAQDSSFVNASFGYNIAMRDVRSDETEQLREAATAAGIIDRILLEKEEFNAPIGENGNLLSSGERQRLGLARSLFNKPSLLVLDEPTSNLDMESEEIIWESLTALRGKMTVLIVSHRDVPLSVYDQHTDMAQLKARS